MHASKKAQVQLRFEIFNVFNNLNFLSQGLNNNMSLSAVTLNPSQTAIGSYTAGGTFGQATRTRDPRQMQFGLKVLF
jgi:hypothetical protein